MKLSIELIPKTAWFKNLRNHVGQAKWDTIRRTVYFEAGYRCEICLGVGDKHPVEAHEIWEFKDSQIILKGMIALCPPCHEVKHIGLAQVRGRLENAKKHLMKVNRLTSDEADDLIVKAFETYNERSKQEWELNLEAINEYL